MAGKFKRDKNCLVIMKLQWDQVFHCSDGSAKNANYYLVQVIKC